mgnify:CR=1 FL=1
MVLKKVSHIVTRPGRITGSSDAEIPVAEDLATVPGVPKPVSYTHLTLPTNREV